MALTLNGTTNTIAGVAVGGLPDGIVDTDTLASSVNTIRAAQQFRLLNDETGSASTGTVLDDWEEVDTDYQAIAGVWSHSSGIFSTTSTGIYVCSYH